ncbi:MAG: SPOR domain-containing protein, partial [Gemmatimonadaceae bacterium]
VRHPDGAADLWRLVRWDGFRPRRANLDDRLSADAVTDTAAADSAFAEMVRARYGIVVDTALVGDTSTLGGAGDVGGTASGTSASTPDAPLAPPTEAWMVGFATLSDEVAARRLAGAIRGARLVPATRDGAPAWRVIAGPYPSREAAERAGIASDRPFWVFEAGP